MSSQGARRRFLANPPKGDRPTDRIDLATARVPERKERRRGLFRWMFPLGVFLFAAVVLLLLSLITAIYWQARSDQSRPVDAIVVLGAAQYDGRPSAVLQSRLDTAFDAWNEGLATVIIVTGGKLDGDRFTEAEASRDYLVANGVPESAILLENEGNSTEESLDGVAVIMSDQQLQSALFVSDGFHLFRTKYIADSHGIDGYGLPAEDSPIMRNSPSEFFYVIRETAAVISYWWNR
jgi:uncharacterized SAM-binding protein YcdF (DUF218 family)